MKVYLVSWGTYPAQNQRIFATKESAIEKFDQLCLNYEKNFRGDRIENYTEANEPENEEDNPRRIRYAYFEFCDYPDASIHVTEKDLF